MKAAVPVLHSMAEIKKVEEILLKMTKEKKAKKEKPGLEKDAYDIVKDISPFLHTSLRILNTVFSEGAAKRKTERHFSPIFNRTLHDKVNWL